MIDNTIDWSKRFYLIERLILDLGKDALMIR